MTKHDTYVPRAMITGIERSAGASSISDRGGQIMIYQCPQLAGERPKGLKTDITCEITAEAGNEDPN